MSFKRIQPPIYHNLTATIKNFYHAQGMIASFQQNSLSVLAACEDSQNIAWFKLNNQQGSGLAKNFACIQTGQMGLECELLEAKETSDLLSQYKMSQNGNKSTYKDILSSYADTYQNPLTEEVVQALESSQVPPDPALPAGYYCDSTSTRDEARAGDGRRYNTFAMSEFELYGTYSDLQSFLENLLSHLGFRKISYIEYEAACSYLGVTIIDDKEEKQLCQDLSSVVLLGKFPKRTDPYWNMKYSGQGDLYNKIDVLIHGVETMGTAERSCDRNQMRKDFYTQDDGKYAQRMFSVFGKERVEHELEKFLGHTFVSRFGGGIGLQRLIEGMEKEGLDLKSGGPLLTPQNFLNELTSLEFKPEVYRNIL
jgi:hypothetical protein